MATGSGKRRGKSVTRLIFVYNAEAGIAAGLVDTLHKLVSPATYACDLCAITYGLLGPRKEWRAWLAKSAVDAAFFHRRDFRAAYPGIDVALPAILVEADGQVRPLLDAKDFAGIDSVPALTDRIEAALRA